MRNPYRHRLLIMAVLAVCGVLTGCVATGSPAPTDQRPMASPAASDHKSHDDQPLDRSEYTNEGRAGLVTAPELRRRADQTSDLRWLRSLAGGPLLGGPVPTRPSILVQKGEAIRAADVAGEARANAILASEAFSRAAMVVEHWLDERDPATGLMANRRTVDGQLGWYYQDTGADLYPHIAIGTRLLLPDRYPEVLEVLAAERQQSPSLPSLPDDLLLPRGQYAGNTESVRLFGAAEYAKDGLLPLIEHLGPDPWLGRLREMADAILAASATPTRRGSIPATSNEVNGDVLQVLARAYWATGDERYYRAAERIGETYLEDMLPKTTWLPSNEWNFVDGEPIGRRRLRLSDHGNEIISGLVEWHLIESLRGEPNAVAHRIALRRMVDRLLERGRNPDGLWYRVVEIPSGKVEQDGLSDNWGYVLQPILTLATLERTLPGGQGDRADRYEEAARQALRALPRYAYYPWQHGEMDGYADSLESALYLLSRLPDPEATAWVDEQIAVLFGSQDATGVVEDNYLDGNFVRTALLYGLSLTQGVMPDPWRPDVGLGAAADGRCVSLVLTSIDAWDGRLRFDSPRHRDYLRLPIDYPRLNEWPERFVAEAGRGYDVTDEGSDAAARYDGAELASGILLRSEAGAARHLRVCPAT